MTVAHQPGRLQTGESFSPRRQAGILCLLVLWLSAFVIIPVHARGIGESTIHSSGRIVSNPAGRQND